MLRSTPRIEVNQRSREARLRLERGGTPYRRSNDETVVACSQDWWLGCQAAARAKPIGFRPSRPNRSRSVTTNGCESFRTEVHAGLDRDDPPSAAATRSMSRRSLLARVPETGHHGFRAADRRRESGDRGRSRSDGRQRPHDGSSLTEAIRDDRLS